MDSPDGYVPVNLFINKGMYEEFVLEIENFESVRCNGDHLFETKSGWKKASVLYENSLDKNIISVLTKLGYKCGRVVKTGEFCRDNKIGFFSSPTNERKEWQIPKNTTNFQISKRQLFE